MKKITRSKKSVKPLAIIFIIAAAATLLIVAWLIYSSASQNDNQSYSNSETSEVRTDPDANPEERAPSIDENADLKEAEEFLNDTDIDSALDTSELDSFFVE